MSNFEKIINLDGLIFEYDEDKQKEILNFFGIPYDEYKKRIIGKNKEFEFLLILYLTENFESILGYDEKISNLSKEYTSDLIVTPKNEKKFLLEIKHTDKESFEISLGNLRKRMEFAKKEGLDLFFAISIKGFWMLFDAKYIEEKKGKIVVDDAINSKLYEILKIFSYVFYSKLGYDKGNFKVISVFSKTEKNNLEIMHNDYGKLLSFEFFADDKEIFKINFENKEKISLIYILEGIFDKISNGEQKIYNFSDKTYIIEKINAPIFVSEIEFLLSPIEHIIGNDYKRYDIPKYTKKLVLGEENLKNNITLVHIRNVIDYLVVEGVKISCSKNGTEYCALELRR